MEIRRFLREHGWPDPIYADSGNGGHLVYGTDLPNDNRSRDLLERFFKALDLMFSVGKLKIDTGVFNASRIWKLYGTMACKGSNIPERPHRFSKVLEAPEKIEIVTREMIESIAAMLPEIPRQDSKPGTHTPFNLQEWMSKNGISVAWQKPWQGGTAYILEECPFNPEHNRGEVCIIQFPGGALSFTCLHNSCQDNDWHAVRDKLEPGWREKRSEKTSSQPDDKASDSPRRVKSKIPWPKPLADEAYYGPAGTFVNTIQPYSEADPVAILMNFLTAFGNILGDRVYFKVEEDKHPMRLFCVLVGDTSKARKGISWGYPKTILGGLQPEWKENIVAGLSSGEGLIWAVRDEIVRRQPVKQKGRVTGYEEVIVDDGVTDKRLLVMEGEFASTLRVLGREGNILSAVIRNAWDTGDLQILTKNNPAKATGAHISIIGHITTEELLRYLSNTEAANGFGNRFLWFCVKRSKCIPFDSGFSKVNVKPLITKLSDAIEYVNTSNTETMSWAEKTKPLWKKIYPELSEGKPGLIGALTARAEAYVTRLACIYALLDKSLKIEPPHLAAALAIWDYVESSIQYIFQDVTGDPLANEIFEVLSNHPSGMTRTEIYQYFNCNVNSERITVALKTLEKAEKVQMAKVEGPQGRSREVWIANLD